MTFHDSTVPGIDFGFIDSEDKAKQGAEFIEHWGYSS